MKYSKYICTQNTREGTIKAQNKKKKLWKKLVKSKTGEQ